MIGLDTSAIIDLFKGEERIKKLLEEVKEPLASTMLNYLELFFGIDLEKVKHKEEAQYYMELFEKIYSLGLTKESCEKASEIFWRLKKEGRMVEKFDCVIAAIFLVNGVDKIITKNVKHFEKIKSLNVLSY